MDKEELPLKRLMGELKKKTTQLEEIKKHLEKSEAQYKDLVEKAGVAIGVDDKDGNIKYFNQTFADLFEYSPEEMKKMSHRSFVHPDDIEMVSKFHKKRIQGKKVPSRYEFRGIRKDGSVIYLEIAISNILEEEGQVIGTRSYLWDITDRKKAEQDLQESEEKFKILFKENPAPQVYLDEDLRILDINSRFKELFGYELDEIKGKNIDDVVVPEGMMEEAEDLNERAEKGYFYFYHEIVRENKDGRKIPVSVSGISLTLEGRKRYITTYEDITERKRAEEKLRKERDKAQKYLDVANVIMVVIDSNQKVNLINRKGCEVLGYEEEEILGKNWYDNFVPERIRDKVKAVSAKLMAGEVEPVEYFENPILTKSGEERLIAWHNTILRDEEGNIVATLSSGEDITERKKAEEKLKDSEERFRYAFEESEIGKVLTDLDGHFQRFNNSFCRMLGYTEEELLSKEISDITHPDDTAVSREHIKRLIEGKFKGDTFTLEKRYLRKDGRTIWGRINVVLIRDRQGKPLGMMGEFEDFTERKKAEKVIKESEEKYRTITENIKVGIYRNTPGPKGRFIEANPATIKMFGYDKKEDILKFNVSNFYQNPEDRKKFNEKMFKDGFVRNEEIRLKKKDGTPIWGSVTVVAVRDEKGTIKYYDGMIDDITKRKEMEENLKKSYEETKMALERERKFIKKTSHNFFNPLCIAKGYLALQLERDIPEEMRKEIKAAKRAVERIEKIVKKSVGRG